MSRASGRRLSSDLRWVGAFVAVCLVLLGVKLVMVHAANRGAHGPQGAPGQSTRATPMPLASVAQLWKSPPTKPRSFSDPALVRPQPEVARGLEAATSMRGWPELANTSRIDAELYNACDDVHDIEPQCVVSPSDGIDPAKVAVVVGDTTMGESYWYTMRAALPKGWTLVGFVLSGCPGVMATPVHTTTVGRTPEECARHHAAYAKVLAKWKPAVVVLADGEETPYALVAGDVASSAVQRMAQARYRLGLTRFVRTASAPGRKVVVLSPPPAQRSIASCLQDDAGPLQCQQPPYATWFSLNAIDREVTQRTGAAYADLLDLFCRHLVCPGAVPKANGTIVVRSDAQHLTPEYSQFIAASLRRYLISTGLVAS